MSEKACARCGEVKPLEDFSPNPQTKDGRNRVCRECVSYRRRICKASVARKEGEF